MNKFTNVHRSWFEKVVEVIRYSDRSAKLVVLGAPNYASSNRIDISSDLQRIMDQQEPLGYSSEIHKHAARVAPNHYCPKGLLCRGAQKIHVRDVYDVCMYV